MAGTDDEPVPLAIRLRPEIGRSLARALDANGIPFHLSGDGAPAGGQSTAPSIEIWVVRVDYDRAKAIVDARGTS